MRTWLAAVAAVAAVAMSAGVAAAAPAADDEDPLAKPAPTATKPKAKAKAKVKPKAKPKATPKAAKPLAKPPDAAQTDVDVEVDAPPKPHGKHGPPRHEVDVAPEPLPAVSADVPHDEPVVVHAETEPPHVVHTLGQPPKLRRWYVRAGVARVIPLSTSSPLTLADVDGPASLAIQDGPIVGSGSTVAGANAFAAILGYRLGHTGRWALETVLGPPFTVKFRATGTLANMSLAPTALGLPTGVQPLGPELGEATAAPPMVTLVYGLHDFGPIHPYVGAGASVLFALKAKVTNPTLTAVGDPDFHVSPAPGFVIQAGIDANLTHRIYARLDLKFIAGMEARAEVTHIQVATPDLPLFGQVEVGSAKMNVMVNPLVLQGAIGTDF